MYGLCFIGDPSVDAICTDNYVHHPPPRVETHTNIRFPSESIDSLFNFQHVQPKANMGSKPSPVKHVCSEFLCHVLPSCPSKGAGLGQRGVWPCSAWRSGASRDPTQQSPCREQNKSPWLANFAENLGFAFEYRQTAS